MILTGKHAVIYGVGDSLGGAIARAFAAAGATVFLTARRLGSAAAIADEIRAAGGAAEAEVVDALDERQVRDHVERIARRASTIDISFNLINMQDVQNAPLAEMASEDFVRPVTVAMRTQFYTMTAAARVMIRQRSGVILSLTATPAGIGYPKVGGFGPACCAIEALSRDLASEVGPSGVRVVNLRSAGSPDSRPFRDALAEGGDRARAFVQRMADDTMLKRLPAMADIAHVATFLASDLAGAITGVTVDVTAGTTAALNYKAPDIAFVG